MIEGGWTCGGSHSGGRRGYCMNWHIVTTPCQWSGILCILLDPCCFYVIIVILLNFFHPYIHYVLLPIGSSIPHQLMPFCGWLSLVRLKSAPAPCSRESMHQAAGSNSSSRENINLLLLWGRLASTDGLLTWGGDTILTMASFEIQLLTLWFCGFHNHEISVPFQGAVLVVCKICPTQSGDNFIQGYVPYLIICSL